MGILSARELLNSRPHPGFVPSRGYYPVHDLTFGAAGAIPAADIVYLYPNYVPRTVTITHIAVRVITGGAGSSVKVGIWRDRIGRPYGAPVVANNTGAATTSNSTSVDLAAAVTLTPGWYWFGTKATGTLPVVVNVGANILLSWIYGLSALTNGASTGISLASTYADNMPTFSASESWTPVTTAGVPVHFLKV
jgi:hypothetical protein